MENLQYKEVLKSINDSLEKIEDSKNEVGLKCQEFLTLIYDNEPSQAEDMINQIDSMTTDQVALIYYAIEDSHHSPDLDKFKPL